MEGPGDGADHEDGAVVPLVHVRSWSSDEKRPVEVVEFEAGEDWDVLRAAADWIEARPYAVIAAVNWQSSCGECEPNRPTSRMRLVIDHEAAAGFDPDWPATGPQRRR